MSRYFFTSILVPRRGFAKVRILKKYLDLGHFGRSFWVILGGFPYCSFVFPLLFLTGAAYREPPGPKKIVEKTFSGACQIFVLGHPGMPPACSRASARPLRARATSRCTRPRLPPSAVRSPLRGMPVSPALSFPYQHGDRTGCRSRQDRKNRPERNFGGVSDSFSGTSRGASCVFPRPRATPTRTRDLSLHVPSSRTVRALIW